MKKLLLFLSIISSFLQVQAQTTFAPVGAEWWYDGSVIASGGLVFITRRTSIGEIQIQDKMCKEIRGVTHYHYVYSPTPSKAYSHKKNEETIYVYSENDTVYVYNSFFQKFTPLYIFNVNPGDTVCIPKIQDQYHPTISGDSFFCYRVDSITTNLYGANSLPLKTVHINAFNDGGNIYEWPFNWYIRHAGDYGMYTELLGGASDILPDNTANRVPDGLAILLDCYTDPVNNINSGNRCSRYPGVVSINEMQVQQLSIQVYPNPATDKVAVTLSKALPKGSLLQVLDITGRVAMVINDIADREIITFDVHTLPQGTYLVRLQSNGNNAYKKLVIGK